MNTYPYPSDLTDEEWTILAPLIIPGKQAGHPQVLELRRIVDAVFYLLHTGCQWRAMPRDLPSWTAVFHHYAKWRAQGTWERINAGLRERHRVASGRKAQPTAAIIDTPLSAEGDQARAPPRRAARAAMMEVRRCPVASDHRAVRAMPGRHRGQPAQGARAPGRHTRSPWRRTAA